MISLRNMDIIDLVHSVMDMVVWAYDETHVAFFVTMATINGMHLADYNYGNRRNMTDYDDAHYCNADKTEHVEQLKHNEAIILLNTERKKKEEKKRRRNS